MLPCAGAPFDPGILSHGDAVSAGDLQMPYASLLLVLRVRALPGGLEWGEAVGKPQPYTCQIGLAHVILEGAAFASG